MSTNRYRDLRLEWFELQHDFSLFAIGVKARSYRCKEIWKCHGSFRRVSPRACLSEKFSSHAVPDNALHWVCLSVCWPLFHRTVTVNPRVASVSQESSKCDSRNSDNFALELQLSSVPELPA